MARPFSDVDPRRMNAEPKRKKRKDRKKPDPKQTYVEAGKVAEAELYKKPIAPGIILEPGPNDNWRWTSPHSDFSLWEVQLHTAFGTRSVALVDVFVRQLRDLCPDEWDADLHRWKTNETYLNAALALVNDVQPRNASEASLAAQMVAIHWLQMRLAHDALNRHGMVLEKQAALASKLARTYTMQLEQLRAMRGEKKPVRQTITVRKTLKQEVHYHDHRTGGGAETDGQPQAKDGGDLHNATAGMSAARPALPRPHEVNGEVVPFPGDAERAVSPPRRAKSGRSEG